MGLKEELEREVKKIFRTQWNVREGKKVPESEDIQLGNYAVKLDATVLYADLAESTYLVDNKAAQFAAEIYKTYLYCAAKLIRYYGGAITSYDGDRVMGIFIGGTKNTTAAKVGLKINYAVKNIITSALQRQYKSTYEVKQVVGIDKSELFAARTGIRGSNDIVWVGRAANYAAKLTSQSPAWPTWITQDVYSYLKNESKYGKNGENMWTREYWEEHNMYVYKSSWWWGI